MATTTTFLVSTYTSNDVLAHIPKGEHGKGVYAWALDSTTGKLSGKPMAVTKVEPNPAFLVKHPTKDILFCSTECIHDQGEVITFEIKESGKLQELARYRAGGRSTCYLTLCCPDTSGEPTALACVNYWDAIVSLLPVDPQSGQISGPLIDSHMQPGAQYVFATEPDRVEHWTYRQRWPHTHCFVTEPYDHRYHFVPDLGQDIIWCFAVADGKLVLQGGVQLEKGQGPRHVVFHPREKVLYVINELKSTVSALTFHSELIHGSGTGVSVKDSRNSDPENGAFLQHVTTLRTLPDDYESNDHHKSHASEIRLHPSSKYLLIANRGHNSIAVYFVGDAGELRLANITPSGGAFPRNFNFDATGSFVVVGNQNSNNLTVFEFNIKTGAMKIVDKKYQPSPNFVYSVPQCATLESLPNTMSTFGNQVIDEESCANTDNARIAAGKSPRMWNFFGLWAYYLFALIILSFWGFAVFFVGNRADL